MKDVKQRLNNSKEDKKLEREFFKLRKEHDDLHQQVMQSAVDAQSTHDQILVEQKRMNKNRERANSLHKKLAKSKAIADDYHKIFIALINRKTALVDIVNKTREEEE